MPDTSINDRLLSPVSPNNMVTTRPDPASLQKMLAQRLRSVPGMTKEIQAAVEYSLANPGIPLSQCQGEEYLTDDMLCQVCRTLHQLCIDLFNQKDFYEDKYYEAMMEYDLLKDKYGQLNKSNQIIAVGNTETGVTNRTAQTLTRQDSGEDRRSTKIDVFNPPELLFSLIKLEEFKGKGNHQVENDVRYWLHNYERALKAKASNYPFEEFALYWVDYWLSPSVSSFLRLMFDNENGSWVDFKKSMIRHYSHWPVDFDFHSHVRQHVLSRKGRGDTIGDQVDYFLRLLALVPVEHQPTYSEMQRLLYADSPGVQFFSTAYEDSTTSRSTTGLLKYLATQPQARSLECNMGIAYSSARRGKRSNKQH